MSISKLILTFSLILLLTTGCGRDTGKSHSPQPPLSPSEPDDNASGGDLTQWKNLPVALKFDPTTSALQQEAIMSAIATWEEACGRKLIVVDGYDYANPNPQTPAAVLADRTNGVYMIGDWKSSGRDQKTLGVTSWRVSQEDRSEIVAADILFNSTHYIWGDSMALTEEKRFADVETVALHELGHFLGLPHVDHEMDPDSIMNPSLSIGRGKARRVLSGSDVNAIESRYGSAPES